MNPNGNAAACNAHAVLARARGRRRLNLADVLTTPNGKMVLRGGATGSGGSLQQCGWRRETSLRSSRVLKSLGVISLEKFPQNSGELRYLGFPARHGRDGVLGDIRWNRSVLCSGFNESLDDIAVELRMTLHAEHAIAQGKHFDRGIC